MMTFINKLQKKKLNNNFNPNYGVGFFETISSVSTNYEHILSIISVLLNNENKYIYLNTDLKNNVLVLHKFLLYLKKISKNNKITVYFHNFSNFEGLLLLKALNSLDLKKEYLIRNNEIFKIKLDNILFLDSYKLFPHYYSKFSEFFFLKKKLIFNQDFNNFFLLKNNINLLSVLILQKLIFMLQILNHILYQINNITGTFIYDYTSIGTIIFTFYRNFFIKNNLIFNLIALPAFQYSIIEKSYKGGITDVYIPKGQNLLYYDINSAYGYSMLQKMPVGIPKKITNFKNFDFFNFFGFLKVYLEVPYSYIPFLGYKKPTGTTIYPYGYITTELFSEELKHAIRVNKVKIIKIISAISFDKQYVFNDYVKFIFKKKKNSLNIIDREIYKQFLTHLYGRFGLKKEMSLVIEVDQEEFNYINIFFNSTVIDTSSIKKKLIKIEFTPVLLENIFFELKKLKSETVYSKLKKILLKLKLKEKNFLIGTHIASAITSYARIRIDFFKRLVISKNINIYYSDTDSLIVDNYISKKYISNKIGDLKLVYKIKKGIFLTSKSYILSFYKEKNFVFRFKGINSGILKKKYKKTIWNLYSFILFNTHSKNSFSIDFKIPKLKDFNSLSILSAEKIYTPTLDNQKRKKIFYNNTWVNTKPHFLS